jgi:hypothetical protein
MEPSVLPSVDPSDQEFAEPAALSSTSPADFPPGHLPKDQPSTYSGPVKLRPSRAPCSAQDRESGKDAAEESSALCGDPPDADDSLSGQRPGIISSRPT